MTMITIKYDFMIVFSGQSKENERSSGEDTKGQMSLSTRLTGQKVRLALRSNFYARCSARVGVFVFQMSAHIFHSVCV